MNTVAKQRPVRSDVRDVMRTESRSLSPKDRIGARQKPATPSVLESLFAQQCRALKLPVPVREHRFATSLGRQWRFDFAWPAHMLAVECEGGVWTHGRHTRGSGFSADMDKYNTAVLLGWRVLRFGPEQIKSGDAVLMVERALAQ